MNETLPNLQTNTSKEFGFGGAALKWMALTSRPTTLAVM